MVFIGASMSLTLSVVTFDVKNFLRQTCKQPSDQHKHANSTNPNNATHTQQHPLPPTPTPTQRKPSTLFHLVRIGVFVIVKALTTFRPESLGYSSHIVEQTHAYPIRDPTNRRKHLIVPPPPHKNSPTPTHRGQLEQQNSRHHPPPPPCPAEPNPQGGVCRGTPHPGSV